MYTVPKNTEITPAIIAAAIAFNEERRAAFTELEEYYIAENKIKERSKSSGYKPVITNHASYIVDIAAGYMLGNEVEYQVEDKSNIDAVIEAYKEQSISDLDLEIATDMGVYGLAYELVYADEEGELQSVELDARNTIIIYDSTVKHKKLAAVNYMPVYQKDGKTLDRYDLMVIDGQQTKHYTLKDTSSTPVAVENEDEAHYFGQVPVIEYRNNKRCLGDFKQVLSLLDAYNIILSDRIHDRKELADAILAFFGMNFTEEQKADLAVYRMLSGIPEDARVEYITKQLNEADIDVLRKSIEGDIHKISKVPNLSDAEFAGNSSGVALAYKLLAFVMMVKAKSRYFERGLMERMRLYITYLSTKSKVADVKISKIDAIFKMALPKNDFEISQMVNNLLGIIDKELLAGQLSFVVDAKETVKKAAEEAGEPADDDYGSNEVPDKNKDGGKTPADDGNAE
jgi:SPP1 family phage portal protein